MPHHRIIGLRMLKHSKCLPPAIRTSTHLQDQQQTELRPAEPLQAEASQHAGARRLVAPQQRVRDEPEPALAARIVAVVKLRRG
eukprot:357188-Chlamydomonas_euryale.AAC.2